jgi:23S rRNA (cytosine1962-C5)-methyltransferase
MQVLAKSGAAADHPIDSSCPETEYLKAVWMRLN